MVTDAELEGFRRDRYFSRAWALLTRDRGWVKPVLVMTVALLVPVVGLMGVLGYVFEWVRLTAWGVNAAPKQKNVRVGECIASGARVFFVILVWFLGMSILGGLLAAVPLVGGLLYFAWFIFSIFLHLVTLVAALRATIYQKFGAAFRLKTIWQMASHDVGGLLRPLVIMLVEGVVVGIVCTFVALTAFMSFLPQLIGLFEYNSIMSDAMRTSVVVGFAAEAISSLGLMAIVLILVNGFVVVIATMLCCAEIGLWMRQFNVPAWGRDEDPLPETVPDPHDAGFSPAPARPEAHPTPDSAPAPASAPFVAPVPAPEPKDVTSCPSAPDGQTSEDKAVPEPDVAPEPASERAEKDQTVIEVTPIAVAPTDEISPAGMPGTGEEKKDAE